MPPPRQSPRFVPNFGDCIPIEKVEDLVGCDLTVEGGVRFVHNLSSAPFEGKIHVSGIQHHDARELYLQLPDRTFVRLTEASRIMGWVRSCKVVESVITFHDPRDLSLDEQELYSAALQEADRSQVLLIRRRGSMRNVGAAARDDHGIFSEHVLWGDTRCPEAKLLLHAQHYGRLPTVRKIALSSPSETLDDPDPRAPCGVCRQRILECQEVTRGPITILFPGGYGQVARVENVEALLPFARVGVAK